MATLYRLVYASKSLVRAGENGIDLEIGRILSKSKRNNARQGIGGVLYYGDGYFFQVLEGPEEAVKGLYSKICEDQRHTQARILDEHAVSKRLYGDWSMRFIPKKSEVRHFLYQYGVSAFRPFEFSSKTTKALVLYFSRKDEPVVGTVDQIRRPGVIEKLKNLLVMRKSSSIT